MEKEKIERDENGVKIEKDRKEEKKNTKKKTKNKHKKRSYGF